MGRLFYGEITKDQRKDLNAGIRADIESLWDKREKLQKENRDIRNPEEAVPDAPFKDIYHEFILKRLLRMASEEGYDSIGWTTADIQSERWSEDYAEGYRIEYDQEMPKFLKKYGRQWGAKVEHSYIDENGTVNRELIVDLQKVMEEHREDLKKADSIELVSEIQQRIIEVQKTIEKLSGTKVWSMDLTDSMKDTVVNEGQVLYSIRRGMTDSERYEVLKDKKIALTAKADKAKLESVLVKLKQNGESFSYESVKFQDKVKLFKKIGEEFGVFKEYSNRSINLSFEYSKSSLEESVHKQRKNYQRFAKMLTCLDKVIENAVGIEIHNRNKEGYKTDITLKEVYVLASVFEDGNDIIPVKLEVKEFTDKKILSM
ncbi:MAG: hypothetical protein E7353_06660 [Clostridiales bacterium]|nr:hypothetical protein [Clostridiales bacterium]